LQNISLQTDRTATKEFELEIRFEDVSAMKAAIKANTGIYVPSNLQAANKAGYCKYSTAWSFIVNYVSEGSLLNSRIQSKSSGSQNTSFTTMSTKQ
jgi:hypothetical protein